jgi:uncharacterized protein DUF929
LGRRATINSRARRRRILAISAVVAIIAVIVVVYFVASAGINPYASYIGQPVSQGVFQQVTGVSDATLNSVGAISGVNPPAPITGTPLTSGGKPEVLFIGGEYCPFCAVERWSMIMALSRFGEFTGIQYMESSSTDVNPNTPTFTFSGASYSSNYITFVPVEEFDRSGSIRQALTTDQQSLLTQYDTCSGSSSSGGIPFIDIGNAFAVNCGAQFNLDISGDNWTQIASQLNDPSSTTAKLIDGAANSLISAICRVDGGQPAAVCSQSFATVALAYSSGVLGAAQAELQALPTQQTESRWTG